MKHGIILAAGRGSRMGHLTGNQPKCRTVLHGKSLLDWQLEALRGAQVTDIAIVRGYLAESFDLDVHYFNNHRWSETNMVLSLACSRPWLEQSECVISYSDIVYSSGSVHTLLGAKGDIVIAYDPDWLRLWHMRFADPLSDAETFRLEGQNVIEIGNRAQTIDEIEGQYRGLFKLTPTGWAQIEDYLARHTAPQRDAMDMTTLLRGLIQSGTSVGAVAISDCWYEVDSETDLAVYQDLESLF